MVKLENRRILVIDDNKAIHEDFHKALYMDQNVKALNKLSAALLKEEEKKSHSIHFEIHSAYQGEEGLEMIKESLKNNTPFAMAFVDVLMPPGWDGIETMKQIWNIDDDIQFAICTAYARYTWDDIAKTFGITDRLLILKKPFEKIEVQQIACCLITKWNLNQQAGHQYDIIQSRMKEQIDNSLKFS